MKSIDELRDRLRHLSPAARAFLLRELQAFDDGRLSSRGEPSSAVGGLMIADSTTLQEVMAWLAAFERPSRPRVVVTGMGAITPVGLTAPESWEAFVAGRSGVGPVTRFDATVYPTHFGAEVKGFDPTRYIPPVEARKMARCTQFAVVAAAEALVDAGLSSLPEGGARTGVVIGTGLGGFEFYEGLLRQQPTSPLRVRPTAATGGLPNMPAFHISQSFGARGPNSTVVTTCAAGTQAIGDGMEWIRQDRADVVIAGGVEALCEVLYAGFSAMRAISTRNDAPQQASRPFDAQRDGFVIGEGCGILILERLEHALARGARIYAELLGHATSADAYHVAQPEPRGMGAVNAMAWALADAGIVPERVDYINAHGTSTPLNDVIETRAIRRVFGAHADRLAVSSTKSMIGHCLGGAGAIEAIVTVYTVQQDLIHPTINYEFPDPECDLDYVPNVARRARVQVALSNSFGLGGQNACLVVAKWIPEART
ncbi:MAG: beta-ketoacyl-ACP synthase II [Anaerolineae bacterium]|nr:beta-ketoacyl-ACP synthase II [Anaerolineae bacterium]